MKQIIKKIIETCKDIIASIKRHRESMVDRFVIVHHGGGDWNFWQANQHHKGLWNFKSSLGYYVGYQKFIEYDGTLHVARTDDEEGAHCVDPDRPGYWNNNSVGICLQGNFEKDYPHEAQIETLKKELDGYKKKGYKIKSHKDIVKTVCPGEHLYDFVERYKLA